MEKKTFQKRFQKHEKKPIRMAMKHDYFDYGNALKDFYFHVRLFS